MKKKSQSSGKQKEPATVDDYLSGLPDDTRAALQDLREQIRSAAPGVEERISYNIPVFRLGKDLVGLAAHPKHCSFYTMSPPLVRAMSDELRKYEVSGATIHFSPDRPLPKALVKKILAARVKELAAAAKPRS